MKFLLSIAFMLVFSLFAFGQKSDKICKVTKAKHLEKTCQGKIVQIEGTMKAVVMQHPIVSIPPPPGGKETFQSYFDTKFGQIVLISNEEITCRDKVEIVGVLGMNWLGGEVGTKNSYKNALITVTKFGCKK